MTFEKSQCAPNERNYLGDGRSTKFLNLKLENVTSRNEFQGFYSKLLNFRATPFDRFAIVAMITASMPSWWSNDPIGCAPYPTGLTPACSQHFNAEHWAFTRATCYAACKLYTVLRYEPMNGLPDPTRRRSCDPVRDPVHDPNCDSVIPCRVCKRPPLSSCSTIICLLDTAVNSIIELRCRHAAFGWYHWVDWKSAISMASITYH